MGDPGKEAPALSATLPATLLGTLLLTNLLLRLVPALGPIQLLDGLTIPDDAYLSLTIAKNIAAGLGPLYGLEPTNGFQPLYVFLMVPVYLVFPSDLIAPVHVALVLLSLFDALTLYVLYRFVLLWSRSPLTPLFVLTAWILSPYVIATTLNGLETILSTCFIVLCLYFFARAGRSLIEERNIGAALRLGALAGLAVFARIDNWVLLPALIAGLALHARDARLPISRILRPSLCIVAGILLLNLPWYAYSFYYTGDVYPISGRAVRYMSLANVDHQPTLMNWYLPLVKQAAAVLLRGNWLFLCLCLGAAATVPFSRGKIDRDQFRSVAKLHLPLLVFSVLLFSAYTFHIFTPWFFDRYFFPLSLSFLLLAAFLFDHSLPGFREEWPRRIFIGLFFVSLMLGSTLHPAFRSIYVSKQIVSGYMEVGLWANSRFVSGTVIGSSQTGGLGYFASNLTVINLDGVVNRACYESLLEKRNIEYIREQKIEYVLGWPINIEFIKKESANFKETDLEFMGVVQGIETMSNRWLLYRVHDQE
ncbi:hypothetical protein IIC65_04120 [Candidatus Sumerlaeota bacterium]|nr:hypothetical protein [Candidatus Sumerlaeota bacterium]